MIGVKKNKKYIRERSEDQKDGQGKKARYDEQVAEKQKEFYKIGDSFKIVNDKNGKKEIVHR